jgi:Lipopolysaccharide-assembly
MRTTNAFMLLASASCTLLVLVGCAGWQLGQQSLYRRDIRTVYIPPVESTSFRRNLGERLTEALVKEVELKTPYKVIASDDADSILRCRLVTESKGIVTENSFDEPRDIDTNFFMQVTWEDRRGDLLGSGQRVSVAPIVVNVGQAANFVPEGGQSIATAHQEAIERLATQIVGMMEAPW